MDLLVGKQSAKVTDADLLGAGGEARVFRWNDLALKVFHAPDDAKLRKLEKFPRGLPNEVVAPVELITDKKGAVLGYAMRQVKGGEDALRLSQRKWREGVVSNERVCELFVRLGETLRALHARNVVVGDLNDCNVLFAAGEAKKLTQHWLIDADSMQFEGLPCVVGHERFLDPRLYGVDLTARCAFDAGTDWFSYAVMLFGSLLYVHPYGGLSAKYPNLLRRAEARHSVLRSDVQYPRAGVHFRVLPDDLLHWFEETFEKDIRNPLPEKLFALAWTKCRCGTEHARVTCPGCSSLGAAAMRAASRHNGRCTATVVFRTSGKILEAVVQEGLKYLYAEEGVVRREDLREVWTSALQPGLRFAIAGPVTYAAINGQVKRLHEGAPEQFSSGMTGNDTVFAASAGRFLRTEGEWLIDGIAGTRVGKILEGQTWLRTGDSLAFGFYRAGLVPFFFLLRHRRAGLAEVKLPAIDGRIVDCSAVFDDRHVLFSCLLEKDGRRSGAMFLIGQDGALLAQASGPADGSRMFSSARGRALLGGRIVCATDEGLLALSVSGGGIVEGTLFTDTQPFVGAGLELVPGPGGSVYVISTQEIVQLTLA